MVNSLRTFNCVSIPSSDGRLDSRLFLRSSLNKPVSLPTNEGKLSSPAFEMSVCVAWRQNKFKDEFTKRQKERVEHLFVPSCRFVLPSYLSVENLHQKQGVLFIKQAEGCYQRIALRKNTSVIDFTIMLLSR